MKAIGKYITKNWLWIIAGCLLQEKAIEIAYQDRGCFAIGGEWLVLIAVLLLVSIVRQVIWCVKEVTEINRESRKYKRSE